MRLAVIQCGTLSPKVPLSPTRRFRRKVSIAEVLTIAIAALLLAGCASPRPSATRQFSFGEDTFAFENGLVWEYYLDTNGNWTTRNRVPKPDYALHCFPVARAAKEFFLNARFDPQQPKPGEGGARKLIRQVIATSVRRAEPEHRKVLIPGFANVHEFSREYEKLFKEECGSGFSSYFQRGHWRMVLPFSGRQRERTARRLNENLLRNCPSVVHLVNFPSLSINHAVVVFDANPHPNGTEFLFYDPNDSKTPGKLLFDTQRRQFILERNTYFKGGKVQAYEVFNAWNY